MLDGGFLPWIRRTGWVYAAGALVVLVLVWRLGGAHRDPPAASFADGPQPVARVTTTRPPSELLVHVAGAVRRPGVYVLAGETRVIQAVRRAGGPTPAADLGAINLAAPLQDGQQVVVPRRATAASAPTAGPSPGSGPVSISAATQAQLEALDGIGPALARRIIAWRGGHGAVRSVDELTEVPGIGAARLDAIRGSIVP